jgi:hypothetical protein
MKANVIPAWRLFWIALIPFAVVAPLITWLVTGSVDSFAVIYGVEALAALAFLWLRRVLGLPAWGANESYISCLRRSQAGRRHPANDPPASRPA